MTLGYLVGKYKSKLRTTLSGNDNIVQIINPKVDNRFDTDQILLGGEFRIGTEKVILQGYILDFYYVPDTITDNKLFICVEVNADKIEENIITSFNMDIWVFTPKTNVILTEYTSPKKSSMNAKGFIGNRIDICCDVIEQLLKGSDKYGLGIVRPAPNGYMSISAPNNDYYGKRLRYTVKGYTPKEDDPCGN